ncbi:type II secretion system protein [Oceanobacillus damuensis]|uniref:type II secretion system protein n=1 Tax=Oceanobacillus damuensis TaxID=937928 RepID=UPI0008361E80|nr:prepilin-type N-terminal cleavage/methylation domain-containing protein [Oceanobacillus damuensis]
MYNKDEIWNSKGFTLIEIIASIALLVMVIGTFLPFFPQIMSWTQTTDDELVASNLLPQVSSEVKNLDVNGHDLFDNVQQCDTYQREDIFFKEYTLNGVNYKSMLNTCEEKELDLYRTKINILTESGELVSDSFTYISGDLE